MRTLTDPDTARFHPPVNGTRVGAWPDPRPAHRARRRRRPLRRSAYIGRWTRL